MRMHPRGHRRYRAACRAQRVATLNELVGWLDRRVPTEPRALRICEDASPAPPLSALLHNDRTGKVPVESVMFAEAPCPEPGKAMRILFTVSADREAQAEAELLAALTRQ